MRKKSADEQPKKTIAKKVVTPKRRYFVPGIGAVEATDLSQVDAELKKKQEQDNGNK